MPGLMRGVHVERALGDGGQAALARFKGKGTERERLSAEKRHHITPLALFLHHRFGLVKTESQVVAAAADVDGAQVGTRVPRSVTKDGA